MHSDPNGNAEAPKPGLTEVAPRSLPKMATGVAGLDYILHGGLPVAHTTMIAGGPGSGKTMLSLEILFRAAKAGRRSVFVSFEESADAIRTNALTMGWDLAEEERRGTVTRLLGYCRERGITCFVLNQTPLGLTSDHITGVGVSSLIDTMLVLDYVEEGVEYGRSIRVLKSRGAPHSPAAHRMSITAHGIEIHPPANAGAREND